MKEEIKKEEKSKKEQIKDLKAEAYDLREKADFHIMQADILQKQHNNTAYKINTLKKQIDDEQKISDIRKQKEVVKERKKQEEIKKQNLSAGKKKAEEESEKPKQDQTTQTAKAKT